MCFFGPLRSEQTPSYAQNNHKDVNKCKHLSRILNDVT